MSKEIWVKIAKTVEYTVEVDDDFDPESDDFNSDEFFSEVEANETPEIEDWDSLEIELDNGERLNF